jgi:hypothetical protein
MVAAFGCSVPNFKTEDVIDGWIEWLIDWLNDCFSEWLLVLCQAENEALQQLVLEVAHNKQEAQRKVAGLKQKYSNLLAKVRPLVWAHVLSGAGQRNEAEQKQMATSMQTVNSAHTMSAGPLAAPIQCLLGPLAVCNILLAQSNTLSTALQRKTCSLESPVQVFL